MKALIFYAAYGGGHLSVAKAINETLQEKYPNVEIQMIDCIEYINKYINKITTAAYTEMAKKAPWAWGKVYYHSKKGVIAKLSNTSNKILATKLKKLIQKINPDIIISTHPFATQMCAYLKKHKKIDVKIANILTDFKMHEQWLVGNKYVDYFFVSNEEMKDSLIMYGVSMDKVFVTGIPISEKFSKQYDKKSILKQFKLKENLKTILFFAGGKYGLAQKNISYFIEIFAKKIEGIQVVAISGKNQKIYNNFKEIVEKYNKQDKIKILEFTDKVPELMSISDLVITKPGGITVSESLASNVPIIAINPIPGQEEENAEFLEEKKLAVWIRKEDEIENKLTEIIENEEKMQELKTNIKKYARPNASTKICEIILKNGDK